jgi:hypothetical protein
MPARVIRKKNYKSRSGRKSRTQKHRSMNGGDPGRVALPAAYFGGNMDRFLNGSSKLDSCSKQVAVSQGVIHPDGRWAGPSLYPMMGGGCSCRGRKMRNASKRSKKTLKQF